MTTRRATGTLACALLLAGALVASGPPGQVADSGATRATAAAAAAAGRPVTPATTGRQSVMQAPVTQIMAPTAAPTSRCGDSAGAWLGMGWQEPLQWRVNAATVPAYLGDKTAVVEALKNAALNIDTGRNDCGLVEGIALQQVFLGDSYQRAGVNGDGSCGTRDGQNVVSFGPLGAGLLAVTCVWWFGADVAGRSTEADILIDDTAGKFFLSTPPGCVTGWDLEGTVTHEFGHAFGLGHVAYASHGSLTMSDGLPDCTTAYRGLGLGDYLMLKSQYGAG